MNGKLIPKDFEMAQRCTVCSVLLKEVHTQGQTPFQLCREGMK